MTDLEAIDRITYMIRNKTSEILGFAEDLEVNNYESNNIAVELIEKAKACIKQLESEKKVLQSDSRNFINESDAVFKRFASPLKAVLKELSQKVLEYKKGAEKQANDFRLKGEKLPGKIETVDLGNSHVREKWKYKLKDIMLVPVEYVTLTLNKKAVDDAIKMGKRSIPGLSIYKEEILVTRSK